ncbi:DUF4349 domain-containing protein [Candidatus Micrarchaeota archaeon]|nr:DUF4349 domain-containing protein [Candidatus Micrarchaeota archaeon]MBU1165429.1 DUF4349 domain-containing protein [Candidatus Micrarchaeota archaeon]MBU1886976.1 DUF4349 domain-containing protein [Candidatus Micrarchaeota archaeon]
MKNITLIFVLISVLLFGCLDDSTTGSSYPGDSYESAYDEPAMSAPSFAGSGASSYSSSKSYVTQESSITIKVPEGMLETKYDEMTAALASEGAQISDVSYNEYTTRKEYSISLKADPRKFDRVNDVIKGTGEVKSISVDLEDVTMAYNDLDTKIQNREVELQRLYELYNMSDNVSDLLAIEYEITRVETELDLLKGQKQYLVTRIEYSTITVNLYEDKPSTQQLFISLEDIGLAFFGSLAVGISFVAIATGFLLPIVIVCGLVWYGYKKIKKGGKKLIYQKPLASTRIPPPQ